MDCQENVFTQFEGLLKGLETVLWPVSLVLPWTASSSYIAPAWTESVQGPAVFNFPTIPCSPSLEERCQLLATSRTFQNTACPHTNKKHYAKNMCSTCYHKHGRGNYAKSCPHKDKPLYARGKCQSCYLHQYHRSRVFGRRRRIHKHQPQLSPPSSPLLTE